MTDRYLIDTCIWIDALDNRKGRFSEDLGHYAIELLLNCLIHKKKIVVSDFLLFELGKKYSLVQISSIMKPFEQNVENITASQRQVDEAKIISSERLVPFGDAIHAVVARDLDLILVSRDKHFKSLSDIARSYTPEELI
jgi:predicted nucleic acid-binding protein